MQTYTIHHGKLTLIPEDRELKQITKYILAFVLGVILGHVWAMFQG